MSPKLLTLIEDALALARERHEELLKPVRDQECVAQVVERQGWARHAGITVAVLEDALLRARLSYAIGEPV